MPSRQYVNPYIAGSPVTGADMFFGREDVFAFIQRNLIGQHSNHPIVLYGQQRTGKTSVLYQLHRRLGSRYWCVFIDLHGLNPNGMGNLMLGVANTISRDLRRDHQVKVEVPERSTFLADPTSTFESAFLDQVWVALGDNQLVLILDEAVRLNEEVQAGRLEREVFEYLRHLMQHHQRLNFVFSLGSGIEEMTRDYAFLFSVALYHKISFLEPSAARDLIIRPAQDHYRVTDQAVDRILQITSGQPYYTQLVCHCVFDSWMRTPTATIDDGDVDSIVAEAIELGSANLTYVWEDSTRAEQSLMAGIAAAMRSGSTSVTVDQVRDAWRSVDIELSREEIMQALRGLIGREVIAGSDEYSFTVDLQRQWLDKHKRIDWVKSDLANAMPERLPPAQTPAIHSENFSAQEDQIVSVPPLPAMPTARRNMALPGVDRDPTWRFRLESKLIRIGRHPDNDIVLADLSVSHRQAELHMSATGGRYRMIALGGNDTFVNGARVRLAELTERDIVSIGHATFRLVGGELREYIDQGNVALEARELEVTVNDKGKRKVLLDGITFPLAERSMVAVIGPVGTGKSLLLNALTGMHPADKGEVLYDYRNLYNSYEELKHRIGLVPQQFRLPGTGNPHPPQFWPLTEHTRPRSLMRRVAYAVRPSVSADQLTPRTVLNYAAELRFPQDVGDSERNQRVEEVLAELSIAQHADTRIERLSSSRQKCVSIAVELLTRPSILFLDEPTSPFDPHLKRQLFQLMREMADKDAPTGHSVVFISHDVESKLLGFCDRILVLAKGGRMAYFGPHAEGLHYFGAEDWADVFQQFRDHPEIDWAGRFKVSAEYVQYVAKPMV